MAINTWAWEGGLAFMIIPVSTTFLKKLEAPEASLLSNPPPEPEMPNFVIYSRASGGG